MGFPAVAQLAAASLLAIVAFILKETVAEKTTADGPTARFLRSGIAIHDSEERGKFIDAIPSLVNVKEKINSFVTTKVWLTHGRPADDVLSKMKLIPSLDGNLLATPKFKDWLTYVNDFNRKYPRAAKSAASALTSHYGDDLSGNRRFSLMLNAAVGNENTNALALQLQTERWRDWTHKNISPPKVFDFLLLNSDDALKNPLFTSWLKYLDEFNARNPDYRMTLTGALSIGLGSNEKLAEVLETGLSAHGTKAISTTLKNRVFAEWKAKEFTPDFVFENVLRLKKGYWDPNVPGLSDPILKFWLRYTHEFNHRHPRDSTTLLDTLRNNFADASIVTMLVDSKKNPATKALAQGLESLLFTKWLDENLSPRDITRLVYADKSDEMLNEYTRLFQMKKPNVP